MADPTTGAESEDELRARKLRIKQKALELSLKTRNQATLSAEVPSTFQAPESTLRVRADIAADTPHPDLVGAGKVFDDLWRNIRMIGLKPGIAVNRQAPPPRIPESVRTNELTRLSKEAQDNQELYDILAQRRPAAAAGELFTALGLAFAVPGPRVGPGSLLTAPRRISLGSELAAGSVVGLTTPAMSPEQVEFNTLAGTVIGGTVFRVMTGVNRLGQVMIGGRPATLQRVDDLKAAENDLGVTGLLTTGEIRGGRLMQKVEGVFDNMPLPLFGLSGKREAQAEGFQNAVLQIQAAFPEITEDQAKKLLVRQLGKLSDGVQDAYAQVSRLADQLSPPSVKPGPYWFSVGKQRPAPEYNYIANLSDYAPTMYHETSAGRAVALLPKSTTYDANATERLFLSESLDTATGQGKNVGVMFELDAKGLRGVREKSKPTSDIAWQQGISEFQTRHVKQLDFQNSVKSVTFTNLAEANKVEAARIQNTLKQLEKDGWTKEQTASGVKYTKPGVAEAVRTGTPNVQMSHYVARVEKFLAEELAKGANANQAVVAELEALAKQGPVDFITATKIAGDLGVKIRKAERAATDPTATGIDAGRQKQLSMAFFRDIETWAKQFPENSAVVKQWESAKQQYKDNILPFNKRPFAPLFDDAGFDSYDLSKAILDPFKAGKLSQLDESNALAFLFVNNAITESTRSGQVNVKQLANIFARAKNQKALAPLMEGMPPESTRMINSLVKLVDAAPRQFTSNANILRTTAGAAAGLAVVGGSSASSEDPVSGALRGVVTLGLMRWALGSPSGRKLLTAASLVPVENRAALDAIGRRLNQSYQRFLETAVIENRDDAVKMAEQEAQRFGIRVTGPSLRDRP